MRCDSKGPGYTATSIGTVLFFAGIGKGMAPEVMLARKLRQVDVGDFTAGDSAQSSRLGYPGLVYVPTSGSRLGIVPGGGGVLGGEPRSRIYSRML